MPLGMEVVLSPGDFVLNGDQPPPQKGRSPPIFGPRLLWPNGYMDQDATTEVGPGLRDIVLDGYPALPPLKGYSPQFTANVCCGQKAGWTKMPLGMTVDLVSGDFVFDWDPSTLRKKGTPTPTQFLAHVYCGLTVVWINMPLSTEVNLGPGDVVLDGHSSSVFGSCL